MKRAEIGRAVLVAPRAPALALGLLAGALGGLLPAGRAGAQAPATTGAPAPATTGAPAPEGVGQPGVRMVTGQAAVVGGNAAGARERALDEALRQAVELALNDELDPATRASQARAMKTLLGRARSYVKRYRTVDEGEANGSYNIRVEAEVDEAALRRATDRWTAPAAAGGALVARPVAASLWLVVSGPAEAGQAVLAALGSAGIKARLGDPSLAEPARAVQAAAQASFSAVGFVSASVADEGTVRGPGLVAVSCQLAVKVVSAPAGQPLAEPTASLRSFSDREPSARADCLSRAAAALAPRLLSGAGGAGAASGGVGSGDLRVVSIDADVVEPSAVSALLKAVRGIGSVSSAEVRRIVAGRAEIRVRTRLLAPALGAALSRDASGMITLSNVEIAGDLVRVRARLRPIVVAPSAPSPPSMAAP